VEATTTRRTNIQKVLDKLGKSQTVVQDAIKALADKGVKVKKSAMYNVVTGRSTKAELVEALLTAAEAEIARRANIEKRAAKLAA
jgi:biotin operon repressor